MKNTHLWKWGKVLILRMEHYKEFSKEKNNYRTSNLYFIKFAHYLKIKQKAGISEQDIFQINNKVYVNLRVL